MTKKLTIFVLSISFIVLFAILFFAKNLFASNSRMVENVPQRIVTNSNTLDQDAPQITTINTDADLIASDKPVSDVKKTDNNIHITKLNGKYCVTDKNNNIQEKFCYESIQEWGDGSYKVMLNKKQAIIDENGKLQTKFHDNIGMFSEWYAFWPVEDNKLKGMDGSVVVEPLYEELWSMVEHEFTFVVGLKGKYGLLEIDSPTGRKVYDIKYDNIEYMNFKVYSTRIGNKYGLISLSNECNNFIIEPKYDSKEKVEQEFLRRCPSKD